MKKVNSEMHKRQRGLSKRSACREHKKEYPQKALSELLLEDGELPEFYAEPRIVMIPVDPYLVHVYWEINPEEIAKVLSRFKANTETFKPVLRFYRLNSGCTGNCFFDIEINLNANNWYVHLKHPDILCCVKLGFKHDCGWMFVLISSNINKPASAQTLPWIGRHELAINIKKNIENIVCPVPKSFIDNIDKTSVQGRQPFLCEESGSLSVCCKCSCGEGTALTERNVFTEGVFNINCNQNKSLNLTDLCEYSFASGMSSR